MEVSVLNPRSAICHVHLHDLSHATAIVFMITGLALIFYGPPCKSSSCHVHGPPCTSPSYSGSQSSSSFSYFIYVLMLTADARSRSRLLDATFAAVFGHVRCVWPRSMCLAGPLLAAQFAVSSSRPVHCPEKNVIL